jgi:hypothetical protein
MSLNKLNHFESVGRPLDVVLGSTFTSLKNSHNFNKLRKELLVISP